MNILFDNAIGHMYGPHFLVFYGICAVLVIGIGYSFCRKRGEALRFSGETYDAWEIGYLRGGETELARLVALSLVQKGYLDVAHNFAGRGVRTCVKVNENHPEAGLLPPLEKTAFDFLVASDNPLPECAAGFAEAIREHGQEIKRKLQDAGLVPDRKAEAKAVMARGLGFFILIGLAGYKITAALLSGHSNLFFLFMMMLVAGGIHSVLVKPPLQTAAGEELLKGIKEAYKDQSQFKDLESPLSPAMLLLVTGIFGLEVLQGTAYASLSEGLEKSSWYAAGSSTSGGCGGGCAGGGCGGGCGGCGGCG